MRIVSLAALAAMSLASAEMACAQVVREEFFVANGFVNAAVLSGNTLYIGGDFTQLGPATGGFVPLDATTGQLPTTFPRVVGFISDIASDGAGGWFIGGGFSSVGGLPRASIAHIRADNTVSDWNPGAQGNVYALVANASTVYAGGDFTTIGGQNRNYIAAIDAVTGQVTPWDPNASWLIEDLAIRGTTIYVSGIFSTIGGQTRSGLAALTTTLNTNNATAWNPNLVGSVRTMAVSGTKLYVGGLFNNIGGQPRAGLAALDVTIDTNNATPWNPGVNSFVYAMGVSGNTVYVGGAFSTIGGASRNNLAALDATINTNNATAWNPNPSSTVFGLTVNGSTVYVGGRFSTIGGQERNHLAALDATLNTNNATSWNPNANNDVVAIGVSGSTVVAGGNCSSFGGLTRNRLAALDVTTGMPTPWNPNANERVSAMVLSGSTMYVAGRFSNLGGQFRGHIGAVDAVTGAVTAWNPQASGNNVYALAVSGSTVYAGGDFGSIGGQSRNRIAALDANSNTNNATAWNPNANNTVYALALSGSTLYAGGEFNSIGGQSRNRLAAVNTTINTNNATLWNPFVSGMAVKSLLVNGSIVYVGGAFSFIGGQLRSNIAAIDATVNTNNATSWDPGANGEVTAFAVNGSTVYAGGSFGIAGGQARNGMAALDATLDTNNATDWNPNATAGANVLVADGSRVYAGGYFTRIGDVPHTFFAAIGTVTDPTDIAPNTHDPVVAWSGVSGPNPFGPLTRLTFSLARREMVTVAVYDVAGREIARLVDGEDRKAGMHELEWDARSLASGVYLCRLQAGSTVLSRRLVHFQVSGPIALALRAKLSAPAQVEAGRSVVRFVAEHDGDPATCEGGSLMKNLRMILLGTAFLIPVTTHAADIRPEVFGQPSGPPTVLTDEYAFDSGFGAVNVAGYGAGGSMWWLNQFNVAAGFEAITALRIAWGDGPAGVPAEALIFNDPNNDGSPTDITAADLLASSNIVCGAGPTNTFLTYAMPNVFVGNAGESFFVGVCMSNLPGQFPARLDASDPDHARSWFTSDSRTSGIDCSNPNGAGDGPLMLWDSINTQFPGDWMLRANATSPVVSVQKFNWGDVKVLYR